MIELMIELMVEMLQYESNAANHGSAIWVYVLQYILPGFDD